MKKKPLLFALLALAIVTSLTAGTLAVYTRTVSLDGDVQIKKFAFSAKYAETYEKAVKLAPGHSDFTKISVTNADTDGTLAEVDMKYTIVVDITTIEKTMTGLKAELLDSAGNLIEGQSGTRIEYTDSLKADNSAVTESYQVKLTWVDNGNPNDDQTKIGEDIVSYSGALKISVTANQT